MGDWMQTYSGIRFYPLDPRPEHIVLPDVAHALSLTCRFNGHTRCFYSVAEHSVRVCDVLRPLEQALPGVALAGLMHDGAEAYIGDMVRPLKLDMPRYRAAEAAIEACFAEVFHLPPATDVALWAAVKMADVRLLATERRDLFEHQIPWGCLDAGERIEPLIELIQPWPPEYAERVFMATYREVTCRVPNA